MSKLSMLLITTIGLFSVNSVTAAECSSGSIKALGECITCDAALAKVTNTVNEVFSKAVSPCVVDEDCTLAIISSDCHGFCPYASRNVGRFSAMRSVSLVNGDYCADSKYRDHCSYKSETCTPQEAFCNTTTSACDKRPLTAKPPLGAVPFPQN